MTPTTKPAARGSENVDTTAPQAAAGETRSEQETTTQQDSTQSDAPQSREGFTQSTEPQDSESSTEATQSTEERDESNGAQSTVFSSQVKSQLLAGMPAKRPSPLAQSDRPVQFSGDVVNETPDYAAAPRVQRQLAEADDRESHEEFSTEYYASDDSQEGRTRDASSAMHKSGEDWQEYERNALRIEESSQHRQQSTTQEACNSTAEDFPERSETTQHEKGTTQGERETTQHETEPRTAPRANSTPRVAIGPRTATHPAVSGVKIVRVSNEQQKVNKFNPPPAHSTEAASTASNGFGLVHSIKNFFSGIKSAIFRE